MKDMLRMDVKGAFDNLSRNCLLQTVEKIDADGDLMRWTESFMSDRNVSLVIGGQLCDETAIKTGVPQGSLLSPIMLAIYLSRDSGEVEQVVERSMATSFTDYCGWLVVTDSVEQLCEPLKGAGIRAVEYGERNYVAFDNSKDEMIAFTQHQKPDLRRKLADAMIIVRGDTLGFNT